MTAQPPSFKLDSSSKAPIKAPYLNNEVNPVAYTLINVKADVHTKVKLVSKLMKVPMSQVVEQAVALYAQAVQETLKQEVKNLEATVNNDETSAQLASNDSEANDVTR